MLVATLLEREALDPAWTVTESIRGNKSAGSYAHHLKDQWYKWCFVCVSEHQLGRGYMYVYMCEL